MSRTRLVLKQQTGWFAAGREFAEALDVLSDGAFRIYAYVCLRADRRTARMTVRSADLASALHRPQEVIEIHLGELANRGVCCADSAGRLEITDRFWPYQKQNAAEDIREKADFIRRVSDQFLAPGCVQATFSAADENFAARLYERGLSLEQVRRAILLGCARKYTTMINHQVRQPITSLQYFAGVIDEVMDSDIPESYWEHLRRKVLEMETRWLET